MSILEKIKATLFLHDPGQDPEILQDRREEYEHQKADRAGIERMRGPRIFGVLIDYSGSMFGTDVAPSRILAACKAAASLAEMLRLRSPQSYVFIGTFSDRFHLCCPPLQAGKDAKRILTALSNLGDSGNTYIDHGLRGMLKVMKDSCPPELPVTILVLTDGRQSGSKRSVIAASEEIRKAGAEVRAVGFGGSPYEVDEDLMRKVVSQPDYYSFVGTWRGTEALIGEFKKVAGIYFPQAQE